MAQKVLKEYEKRTQSDGTVQEGRIVERDNGKKVFLVGKTTSPGGGGGGSSDGGNTQVSSGSSEADLEKFRQDFINEQSRKQQELLQRQRQEEDSAIGAFQSKLESQERPEALFNRLEQERGVPEIKERTKAIRQRAADLEKQLGVLPDDVTQRLSGTLSTEAQRRRVLAKEQQPIMGGLQDTTRELGVESGNLADALSGVAQMTELSLRGQERLLEPDRIRIAAMSDRAARELSAFTSDRQMELDSIMDKLARTRQLSDQETERAFQLAQSERKYEENLKELQERARLTEESNSRDRQFKSRESALDRDLDSDLSRLKANTDVTTSSIASAGGRTFDERQINLINDNLRGVNDVFTKFSGDDGYVNPQKYKEERQRLQAKGVSTEFFDQYFSGQVNPRDKVGLGLAKASGSSGDPFGIGF